MSGIREQPWLPGQLRSAISKPQRAQADALGECSVWGATDRRPLPARKLVDDYAQFAQACPDSASGIVDACGPKSPDSHRVVRGLTSRPPVPLRAFLRFPVCPPGPSPSSAFLWFPFVRRSPVCSLRPLPGFRFPFGFPPGSLPLSNLHVSAAAGRFRRPLVPGGRDQGHQFCRDHLAWIARSARTTDGQRLGRGWARWDAATEPPVTSGRERRTSPRPNRPDRQDLVWSGAVP